MQIKSGISSLVSNSILAAACIIFVSTSLGESLVLEDGNRKASKFFKYGDGTFKPVKGEEIPRQNVRDWWIADRGTRTSGASPVPGTDQHALKTLKEYRLRARAFADEYPGTSGIHLIDDGVYTLTADKRHVYRYHFVGYIMDESVLGWRDLGLWFSKGRSRARIVLARSLSPDDELFILAPEEATVNTPSRGAVHFDPNSRVLSTVIPGVEVGSVVEDIYEFEQYEPADWRLFFPSYYFQGENPVWRSTFEVRVPKSEKLYSWEQNWKAPGDRRWFRRFIDTLMFWTSPRSQQLEITEDGAQYRVYSWERHRMPPLIEEPGMPPANEITPAVFGTTMKDWSHLNKLNRDMQLERLKPTEKIRKLTAEITADCTDEEAKIAALYHWVQKNVRYISIKASLSSGWAGHPAEETVEQGYGDCTDKAALLATMLRIIGVKGAPVVLRTNDAGLFNPEYPVLACNHAITEVKRDGRIFYLDPTSSDYRYPYFRTDDHGAIAFNFIDGTRRRIPVPPGMQAHGKTSRVEIGLHKDGGITTDVRNRYTGGYEAGLRAGWKRVPEKARHQVMQQYLNGIAPGARLRSFELSDPENLDIQFSMSFSYEIPNYVSRAGIYRIFELPGRDISFSELALENRRFPVSYTTSNGIKRTVTLHVPETLEFVEIPANISLKDPDIEYWETFERLDANTLQMTSLFERSAQRIRPGEYHRYRNTALQIQDRTNKPLYLRIREPGLTPGTD